VGRIHIARSPEIYLGQTIGSGHCVPLVREATSLDHTSTWRRGERVIETEVPMGTAIATFSDDGLYTSSTDGSSHAAILLSIDEDGLTVIDQWVGRPAARRKIRYKNGKGQAADDGDRFYVIES
jgi:hypothetical protein